MYYGYIGIGAFTCLTGELMLEVISIGYESFSSEILLCLQLFWAALLQ